ncbi:MAG: hypothetical protein WC942_06520 [Clostridia bacterium]|jgi:hydroxymethylpyrimidine pyrophosphatase-like HAD family hydrolase
MKTVVIDIEDTIVFNQDTIDPEMVALLSKFISVHQLVLMSNSSWKDLQKNIVSEFNQSDPNLNNLYFLPMLGGSIYKIWGKYGWVAAAQTTMPTPDAKIILQILKEEIDNLPQKDGKLWGKQIDQKEAIITFHGLGKNAPEEPRSSWDKDNRIRNSLVTKIQNKLPPSFDIHMSGFTDINISSCSNKKKGIDDLMLHLHASKDDVTYICSDELTGINDYAAVEMGLNIIYTNNIKQLIVDILEGQNKLQKTG